VLHRDLPAAQFFPTVLAKARHAVDGVSLPEGDAEAGARDPAAAGAGR
jgi:hypothetical protein